jgi:uncharacterized protein YrrD
MEDYCFTIDKYCLIKRITGIHIDHFVRSLEVKMNNFTLNFGTPVHCIEDQCGKLAKVAINPHNWQVTDLIVEEGLLLKHARVFPFSVVERAIADEINIAVYKEKFSKYPEFREVIVEHLPEGGTAEPALVHGSPYGLATSAPAVPVVRELLIEGVDDNLALIDKTTPLEAADGPFGNVIGLVVMPENGLITDLLVHKGTIFVDEFLLSMMVVERISSKGVFVNMTRAELTDLAAYDDEVSEADWDRLPTGEAITRPPEPAPYGGSTPFTINDEAALAGMIADALMKDPRTEDAVIEVIHDRGMVTLQGVVDNSATKQAAQMIATEFPGVVSVMNEMAVQKQ